MMRGETFKLVALCTSNFHSVYFSSFDPHQISYSQVIMLEGRNTMRSHSDNDPINNAKERNLR